MHRSFSVTDTESQPIRHGSPVDDQLSSTADNVSVRICQYDLKRVHCLFILACHRPSITT